MIGLMASGVMATVDHGVAFTILSLIGGKMIDEGLHNSEGERKESHNLSVLILTAIGTHILAQHLGYWG